MNVTFETEKETRNTIRFTEVDRDALLMPKIGTIYVPKATLDEVGWKSGMRLVVSLEAAKEEVQDA
ncbi:MAG: hypothetical protein LIP12_17870 [Clostridiales bacterium]|nr:hypothetical protein [Clostridiales bacterium]